ncbi:MAG: hypothetical protein AAF629_02370 [Chloroflexota bacterium]
MKINRQFTVYSVKTDIQVPLFILGSILLLALSFAFWSTTSAQRNTLTLPWQTIDQGGAISSGEDFQLRGTIGQVDASTVMQGGQFRVEAGFWPGVIHRNNQADPQDPTLYIPLIQQ